MIFEDGDRIVFAGDSVTDMGSDQPVGESMFDCLGHSYVRIIENMLCAWYPELRIRVTNSGVNGNTSRALLERFDRDVVNLEPQWASVCIGVNDVWRQFQMPAMFDWWVMPDEYEKNMEAMIRAIRARVKGLFILSPFYMEPLKEDLVRKRMDEYGEICRRLSEEHSCIFVDLQNAFDRYFSYPHRHSCSIAWDRVHPNQIGATIIAREFLRHCGFDYNRKS